MAEEQFRPDENGFAPFDFQKNMEDIAKEKLEKKLSRREAALQKAKEQQEELLRKREEERRFRAEQRAKKRRKLITPIVMLSAGAVVSITMFVNGYESSSMLKILLLTLVLFYIIGSLIRWMFEVFEKENKEKLLEQGEVIQKAGTEEMDTQK